MSEAKPEVSFPEIAERYPLGPRVKVLAAHPAGLIALEKPVSVLSHPNSRKDKKHSLIMAHYDDKRECYYDLNSSDDRLYLCHRLDAATSGVILLAQNETAAQMMRKRFEERRVDKLYYAIVRGRPHSAHDTWIDHIERSQMPNQRPSQRAPLKPLLMRSKMLFVGMDKNRLGLSLIKLSPYTGRTHQLRLQCSWRMHPILGDKTYGDFMLNRALARALPYERMYLHASELAFEFLHKGELQKMTITSELPQSFNALLETNRDLLKIHLNVPKFRRAPLPFSADSVAQHKKKQARMAKKVAQSRQRPSGTPSPKKTQKRPPRPDKAT
ncbi:MAG: RNA pseudouridine synthase [Verrucomicrobiota bacterium]